MESIKIVGAFGTFGVFEDKPENLEISGYLTNKGLRYSIYDKNSKYRMFPNFLTEEQAKNYIRIYNRKQKLTQINATRY